MMRKRPFSTAAVICYVFSIVFIVFSFTVEHITPIGWLIRILLAIFLTWRMDSTLRKFWGGR